MSGNSKLDANTVLGRVYDEATNKLLINNGVTPGQATMDNSQPVVIASNQSAVPISSATLTAIDSKLGEIDTTLDNSFASLSIPEDFVNYVTVVGGADSNDTVKTIRTNEIGQLQTVPVPTASSDSVLSRAASTALASSLVVKASAGRLYLLTITNTKASAQYIQIHDTAAVPANGEVPVYSFYVPATTTVSFDATAFGDYFGTGITVVNSSTVATKTLGSADVWFTALYK